jgi:pilus assembly protein CpaC
VNPVNGNDIKLPTDGFNAANDAARLFGLQESAPGLDTQPVPTAAPGSVPANPSISQAPEAAIMPGQASSRDRKRRKQRTAGNDAAAPGFSFN